MHIGAAVEDVLTGRTWRVAEPLAGGRSRLAAEGGSEERVVDDALLGRQFRER